jgi:hypothetical protein
MMTWILLIVQIHWHAEIKFNDKATCEQAAKQINSIAMFSDAYGRVGSICIPGGTH